MSVESLTAQPARSLTAGTPCVNGKDSTIQVFEFANAVVSGKINPKARGILIDIPAAEVRVRANYAYAFARIDADSVPPLPDSVHALEVPGDVIPAPANDRTPPQTTSLPASG
jgi:hypothetical protein